MSKSDTFMKLWVAPIALFTLILSALVASLVEDGWWDILCCIALLVPIVLIVKYYAFQNGKR